MLPPGHMTKRGRPNPEDGCGLIPKVHGPEIEDRADPWTPGSSSRWGRDAGPPNTRNTSKGALVHEAQAVFRAIGLIRLPGQYDFDPGDGRPMALRLECFNSVEGSCRFMAVMGWLR